MSRVKFREIEGGKPRARRASKVLPFILIWLLAVGLYAAAKRSVFFTVLDLKAYDLFFRLRNRFSPPTVPDNIVIVAIDEASMQELGTQWPWPRAIHGELVSKLVEQGAAVIVFDILFVDPTNDADDMAFSVAMRRAGNVFLGEDFVIEEDATYRKETWTRRQTWVRPLDLFLDSAKGTGLVKVVRDPDDFVRRASLETNGIPSLDLAVAEAFLRSRGRRVDTSDVVSTFGLPGNGNEPLLINYLGPPHSFKTVSYFEALEPEKYIPKGLFKGAIVLVGRALEGAADLKSPDHFAYPFLTERASIGGVEIHASLIDTLLRRRYVRPVAPLFENLLFLTVLAFGAASLMVTQKWYGALAFWGIVIVYEASPFGVFYFRGLALNAATPLVSCAAFFLVERAYKIVVVDREKRFLHKAFKHYVPPAVVDQLSENPDRLNLYGERFEITVVFTDLVGFTMEIRKVSRGGKIVKVSGGGGPAETSLWMEKGEAWARSKNTNRSLVIETPAATAAIRGTEVNLRVAGDVSEIAVVEGLVDLYNNAGSITLRGGEGGRAEAGKPPQKIIVVNPEDAVQWVLHFPEPERVPSGLTIAEAAALTDRLRQNPSDSAARRSLIDYHATQQQWDAVLETAIYPEAAPADQPTLLRARIEALEGLGRDVDEALAADSAAIESSAPLLVEVANYQLRVGDPAQAKKDISQALSLDPNNQDALALRSLIAVTQNDVKLAKELIDRSLAVAPNHAQTQLVASKVSQAQFDLDTALKHATEARRLAPESTEAVASTAEILFGSGRASESAEIVDAMLKSHPNSPRLLTVSGFLSMALSRTAAAEELFNRAIKLDPEASETHLGLGLCQFYRGKHDEGLVEMLTAFSKELARKRVFLGLTVSNLFDRDFNVLVEGISVKLRQPYRQAFGYLEIVF